MKTEAGWGSSTGGTGGESAEAGGASLTVVGDHLEDIYTLSPLQQGMLFHITSAPGSRLYVDQSVCHLKGKLDIEAFERAWRSVVERHPALRTAFLWQGLHKPVQVVFREAVVPFERLDWRNLSAKVQEAQLQAFLRQDRQHGFDFQRPPLMRLHLIRTGEEEHRLLWTVSHLVVDAWCSSIILEEVIRHYEAYRGDRDLVLEPAPRYRTYIAWLKEQSLERAETFWREYLKGFSRPLAGEPEDGTGPAPVGQGGHRQETGALSAINTDSLRRLARRHHLTLNTLIQGAWGLALAFEQEESGGAVDIVFGTSVSGRPPELPGADTAVGLFINTLPKRVRVEAQQPLLPWLGEIQHQQLAMRQFEHTPLAKIQGWSELPSGVPLFDSLLVFQNFSDAAQRDTGSLRIEGLRHFGRPHYPLTVHVHPGQRLKVELIYDVERFRWRTIRNLIERFCHLLGGFSVRPQAPLGVLLEGVRSAEREKQAEERKKRRDSNTDRLRITRPVAIKLPN